MSEDEAKAKWCPAFRGNDHGVNRPNEIGGRHGFCLASACMAWRTAGGDKFRDNTTGALSDRDLTGNGRWIKTEGYCGLAGAPR